MRVVATIEGPVVIRRSRTSWRASRPCSPPPAARAVPEPRDGDGPRPSGKCRRRGDEPSRSSPDLLGTCPGSQISAAIGMRSRDSCRSRTRHNLSRQPIRCLLNKSTRQALSFYSLSPFLLTSVRQLEHTLPSCTARGVVENAQDRSRDGAMSRFGAGDRGRRRGDAHASNAAPRYGRRCARRPTLRRNASDVLEERRRTGPTWPSRCRD
jgi:hypothetical protein